MALLSSTSLHPPDGFKYLQKETGLWIYGEIFSELVDKVIAHRAYKGLAGLDREEVEKEVQRQICLGAFPGVCQAEPGEDYKPFNDMARSLNLSKIESFSRAVMEWLKLGMSFVEFSESARRAAICRGCPFNKTASACVCTTFFKAIDAMVPADRSEPGLAICSLCGCSLRVKILAPLEVAREGNPENLRLPEWCWQK